MRKKFFLAAILFAAISASFFISCNNSDKTQDDSSKSNNNSTAEATAKVERGRYLATSVAVCIDCHSKRDVTKFSLPVIPGTEGGGSGFPFTESEGVPGSVWATNITPFTLKDWSDDEIARAITRGISRNGDTLFPLMPYHNYSRLAKDDIFAIIAYLRTLNPIDSTVPPRQLKIPPTMFGPLPGNTLVDNKRPDPSDKVNYGQYMITAASCGECHTPRSPQGVPIFDKAYSGGFIFNTPFFKVGTANITFDSTTGIGTWTEDAFVQKFKTNSTHEVVNRNPGRMNTIMPWEFYGKMKEDDLRAIYAYLRSVPPVKNKVEKWSN